MRFHEIPDMRRVLLRQATDAPLRRKQRRTASSALSSVLPPSLRPPYVTWQLWAEGNRHTYDLLPPLAAAVSRFRLDIDPGRIDWPPHAFAVRFPVGHEGLGRVRSVLCCMASLVRRGEPGISIAVDYGQQFDGDPSLDFIVLPFQVLDEAIESVSQIRDPLTEHLRQFMPAAELDCDGDVLRFAVRVAAVTAIVRNDSELSMPVVCATDRARWQATGDPALIERAHRKGLYRWQLGPTDTSDSVRVPHLAIRWTGPGSTVPKLVLVRGAATTPGSHGPRVCGSCGKPVDGVCLACKTRRKLAADMQLLRKAAADAGINEAELQ